jgi:hypothetical protein
MTTPLFTDIELDANIAAYKGACLALAGSGEEYTIVLPDGSRTSVRRSQLPQLREHLTWLQGQRSGGSGFQAFPARITR